MATAAEKTILVVDDSEHDVEILLRAFNAVAVQNPIQVVNNGEDAICYLAGEGRFSDRTKFPMPSVVLLDLKMPGTTGFDVLRWARSKAQLRDLVIIVLTTSELLEDIKLAYELGTNSFLTKPFTTPELNELIKSFHHYWIVSNRTPSGN